MAIAGGFRATTEVFLLPVYAFCIFKPPRTLAFPSLILLILLNLCWLLPSMSLSGGPLEYTALMKQQFFNSVKSDATHAVWFQSEAFKILLLLIQAITIPVTALLLFRIRSLRPKSGERTLLFAITPALVFFLLVYFDKEGYLLFVIPPVIVLTISMMSGVFRRTAPILGVILVSVLLNYRIFVKPPYLGTAGEINRPGETILSRLTTPNRHIISGLALRFRRFIDALDRFGNVPRTFMVKGQYYPDWRLLMYYFPNDQAILITPGLRRVAVAHQHRSEMLKPPVRVSNSSVLLILSNDPPEIPMPFFQVEERSYYYQEMGALPETFRIFDCTFKRSAD
jgi:hypothetical protein